MLPAARIGDKFSDSDAVATGSGNVFVNGIPFARLGDRTTGHSCWPPATIITGSGSVFVNGIPAARLTDLHSVHCCPGKGCHDGVLVTGSGDTFVG